MKIVFFDLEQWEIDYLKERVHNQDAKYYTTTINDTELESISSAEIISTFIYSKVTKEVLDKFPNLKLVSTMSTGFDHIDIDECKKRGIAVCNVPAYGDNTVAEHAFGLLLNLSKNIYKAYDRTVRGAFSYEGLMGFDLKGKTFGVIGTGRIGQCSIKIANGFGMNVIAYDPYPRENLAGELGFRYVSLNELFSDSDVITIHVPLTKETVHMINDSSVEKMKKGVVIINTARGPVIETDALIKGLHSGKIGGAGLDVLEDETLIKDEIDNIHKISLMPADQLRVMVENEALMKHPHVLVTPHLAFYTREALQRILDTNLTNVFDHIENRGYRNQVNK